MRHKGGRALWQNSRQRCFGQIPSADGVLVKGSQPTELDMPGESNWAAACQEAVDLFGGYISDLDAGTNEAAKRPDGAVWRPLFTQRLTVGNELVDQGLEIHRSPPRSTSPTFR